MKLQDTINKFDDRAKKWAFKINQNTRTRITFTLHNESCLTMQMGNVDVPQKNEEKFVGKHLDRRLTWANLIKFRIKEDNLKAKQIHFSTRKKMNAFIRKQTPI
jgi:hypothetical protein